MAILGTSPAGRVAFKRFFNPCVNHRLKLNGLMAKQVTQDTFDDVVKENVQEFDMSVEDAIKDAVEQFESQGVNLNMIIRDAGLYGEDGTKRVHPVIAALSRLTLAADQASTDNEAAQDALQAVEKDCSIDLARRCFAGKNNAYPVLLRSLQQYVRSDNSEMTVKCLQTMCCLCDGQPDLLDQDGVDTLMGIMTSTKDNTKVTEQVVRLVRLNCIKHEGNRQMFIKGGLIKTLVDVLVENKASPEVVKGVAYGLRVLTQDDDVRVPFGSAHENAKQIVLEGDGLGRLIEISKAYTSDAGVQGELFATLSKLVVRDEFCKEVMDLGGLDLIMASFQQQIKHKKIVKQALDVLKALAGNDEIKKAIVNAGGVQLILSAMTYHQGHAGIAGAGCLALATMVLRQPKHCQAVVDSNGQHVILQAMKIHGTDPAVQKLGCMAIRNVVARTRELSEPFLSLGAEELINRALSVPDCEDEAKAALRDLDCKVDLKERWTGGVNNAQELHA